jgi:myosin heavy subunit
VLCADKNKDFLIEDQVKVLLDSKSSFVRGIFAPKPQQPSTSAAPAKGGRSESSAVKFISVASQFRVRDQCHSSGAPTGA